MSVPAAAARPGALGPHDLGGVGTDVTIDRAEHAYTLWERQVHVAVIVLCRKGLLTVDELRRGIEGLPGWAQDSFTYYEKWAASLATICCERGTCTQAELEAQLGAPLTEGLICHPQPTITATPPSPSTQATGPPADTPATARFHAGDAVRVRAEASAVGWAKPHLRTPGYIFGIAGIIERECQGLFGNPEALAFRQPAAKQPMYRVRFQQADVWEGYEGPEDDTVDVEVYEPWLMPSSHQELQQQQRDRRARQTVFHAHQQAAEGASGATAERSGHHHHHHHQQHHHDGQSHDQLGDDKHEHHDGEHGPHSAHVHDGRACVEQVAVDREGPEQQERSRLATALLRVLGVRGVVSPAELRQGVEDMDARGASGAGARLVARAWVDTAFKQRLLQDAGAAAAELGISASIYPTTAPVGSASTVPTATSAPQQQQEVQAAAESLPVKHGTILTVVESTSEVHNLVVCTLCSCYPLSVLGLSPAWYKSRAYRARAVREPRAVLAEFGTVLPETIRVAVHDSTADNRYLVLPMRPVGTEGWDEQRLAGLVTRDTMIGVAVPQVAP